MAIGRCCTRDPEGEGAIFTAPSTAAWIGPVAALSVGWDHACAAVEDGAWCWDANDLGQLGNGTFRPSGTVNVPGPATGLVNVASVATGTQYSCVLLTDGGARCWGFNAFGQLGDGTFVTDTTPSAVVSSLAP